MAGIQLYDIESKSPVDVDPDKVRATMATGRFAFPKGQNVPVIYNGVPAWIKPEDAHKHVDNLTFTTDDAVRKENAQAEYSGVGGIAKGFGYGLVKGGTLGLAPLLAGAVSPAAREEMANAELGAPRATLAGEAASLLFDPIAAGARMFGKGAAGAAGAGAHLPGAPGLPGAAGAGAHLPGAPGLPGAAGAGAHLPGAPGLPGAAALPAGLPAAGAAGAAAALPPGLAGAAGKLPWAKPRMGGPVPRGAQGAGSPLGQAPGFGAAAAGVAEAEVPRLGGGVASADTALGAGKDIRDVGLGRRRALGMGEPETIRAMESPMTLGGPPLESRLMADLRNEQANLIDRRAGIDKLIKSEKKRGKGAGGALDVLGKERADLVSRIDEHEFQLAKYERPEEMALADQSQRAAEQSVMRGPQVSFARGELPGAVRDLAAERQGMAAGVGEARAVREAEDAAAAIEAERAAVREGGLPSEYVGPEGGAALATTMRRPGLGDAQAAQDAALAELQLGRNAAATSELRASLEADAATPLAQPDLLNMSQADLVEHYASNGLPKGVSAYDALTARPSLRGKSQAEIIKFYKENGGTKTGRAWADDMEKTWSKLRSASEDGIKAKGAESDWTNFVVGADTHVAGSNRSKAYATLKDPLALSGDRVEAFLKALRSEGYNGQVKVPASGARALTGFDNIVMHGASEADAALGESVAKRFFGSELEGTAQGVDIGKKSHTTLLADELEKRLAAGPSPGMGMTPAGGQALGLGQPMQPAMPGSPMLGAGPGALPGVAGRALLQRGAGPAAPGLAGAGGGVGAGAGGGVGAGAGGGVGAGAGGGAGGGVGQVAGVAGGIPGAVGGLSLPRAAVESGIYAAATQANNQQLGLEPGGAAEVLKAGALGLGLGAAGHMLGKAFGSSASLAGSKSAGPLAQSAAKAAGGLQDAHLMRMWGIDGAAIERLNREFSELGAGTKGVSNFADFIKATVNDIDALKLANPGDAILQAIPTNRPLRFSDITTERRTAIADALRAKLGKEYDTLLGPAMSAQSISQQGLLAAVQQAEASQIKGLGTQSLTSIAPELAALKDSLRRGETQTVGSLRELRSAMDELFSSRNGQNQPFTKPQVAFRKSLDDLVAQAMEVSVPGSSAALGALNREYTMAKILQEGVISAETKFATMSPVNKETLSKAALGASIGQPLGALGFVVGSTMLRGLYNSRGEGFLADLAGAAERSALRISQNPVGAAQAASQSIINARRPVMAFTNAQQLVSGTPQDFISISKSVRALQETKDSARQQVLRATSNLPPGKQQQAAEHMDAIINALAKELPKGLSAEKALTEQERRYLVFSRSILDPVYATQVLVNGGPDSDEAAKAIKSVPGGQQYLESLAEDLRTQINESEELRGNQELFRLQLSLKSKLRTKSSLGTLHGAGGGGGGPKAPSLGMPHVGSSGQAAAIKAIAGTTKP